MKARWHADVPYRDLSTVCVETTYPSLPHSMMRVSLYSSSGRQCLKFIRLLFSLFMASLGLLLVEEEKATEGRVRPFISWAKALSSRYRIVFLLYKPGRPLVEAVSQQRNVEVYSYIDLQRLSQDVSKLRLDLLLTDDYIRNLQVLARLRRENVRFGVYVQLLFGIHSIADVFTLDYLANSGKFIYKLMRLIPFTLLKKWYVSVLSSSHLVIANSRSTATLLHVLYGVEPSGVVYPPVDTEIFRPRSQKRNMQVLLYLGSHAGDTDVKLVTEVAELLSREKGAEVLVFGNKTLREDVANKFRFRQVVDVSDEELAEIYSSSVVTVAPQKWETFGYVPVESMACGTPVLAFNMMGPSETVIHGSTGWLAENRREFLQYLSSIIKGDLEIEPEYVRRHVEKHFSLATTSAKLEDIIRRYV